MVSIFACTLQAVANDTIKMIVRGNTWVQSHYITATAGEQFKVIYGDGHQQTYTGTGVNQNIRYDYPFNVNEMAITIIALSENCKFTRFQPDWLTISLDLSSCPSIVELWAGNISSRALTNLNLQNCINLEVLYCSYHPLYNLDIAHISTLKYLYCEENRLSNLILHNSVILEGFDFCNNHLLLSNLYALSLQMSDNVYGYCCCQKPPQINVEIGEPVDFSSENVIEGVYTNYWVSRDGEPVSDDEFTFEDGVFTFHYFGNYLVQQLNMAIPCSDGGNVNNSIKVSGISDSGLSSLKVTGQLVGQLTLNPTFNRDIYYYEADVPSNTSFAWIEAVPFNNNATVSHQQGVISLAYGANSRTVTVTAADGITQQDYTVIINRANLLNLSVSPGTLSPKFNNLIYDYTVDVPYSVSSINIYAQAVNASISGIGEKQLTVGENIFIITVVDANIAFERKYTITITRAAPNTDATLLNLAVSEGELTPEFNSIIHDYTVDVEFSINSIHITATTNDPKASISGIGYKQLAVGENIYTITVTPEDGITTLEYTVVVTRADDVGILENSLAAAIDVYPNPTTGELIIDASAGSATGGQLTIEKIEIFDIYGKLLNNYQLSIINYQFKIDISHLQAGTYFLKVITEQGEVIKKVVKQ